MKKLILSTVLLSVLTTASFAQFFGVGPNGRLQKLNSSGTVILTKTGDSANLSIIVDTVNSYASKYKVKGDSTVLSAAIASSNITFSTTGNSGVSSYNTATRALNIPGYTLSGLGGIGLTGLSSATAALGYNNTTGVFTLAQANTSTAGYISNTDWNIFNGKQNLLTNPVTGTGVANQISFFNGVSTVTGGTNLQWNPATSVHTVVGSSVTTTAQITALAGSGVALGVDASGNVHTRVLDEPTTPAGTTITPLSAYVAGTLFIRENGMQKAASEFTATNGTTVTLGYTPFANTTFSIEYTKQVN